MVERYKVGNPMVIQDLDYIRKGINNLLNKPALATKDVNLSMKKVPFAFQNAVRKVYFDILRSFVEDTGLTLNLENYKDDVILSEGFLRSPAIVAIIDSHSPWGEPDSLTNENTPRRLNGRTYDCLKIVLKNFRYRERIEKIADNMRRNLEEEVIIIEAQDIL